MANLKELKSVTDYVALGHTHKTYEIDNWAFNPGSLEITSIDDFRETRGAFLVEVDENNQITATALRDYRQRPFQRLGFDVSGCRKRKKLPTAFSRNVKGEARTRAIIQTGAGRDSQTDHRNHSARASRLSEFAFAAKGNPRRSAENDRRAARSHQKSFRAVEYAVAADLEEDASREKLERRVIEDLIIRDNRYKTRVEEISEAVIGAKRMALSDEERGEDRRFYFIETNLNRKEAKKEKLTTDRHR